MTEKPFDQPSSLAALEAAVYSRRSNAPTELIAWLFRVATGGARLDGERTATRLAALLGSCILDRSVRFIDQDIARLPLLRQTVSNVFAASGFGSADHLLEVLGATDSDALKRLWNEDRQRFIKACFVLSIDSSLPIDVEALFHAEPAVALLVYLSLLSAKPIVSLQGQARRERLLELGSRLQVTDLPRTLDHLVLLSNAWMLCSYAERRDKHQVKATLNRILRAWMVNGGMTDARLPAERMRSERPTLLVAAEIMHSNHVQYRYFGQYLRQLRRRFRLVLLTEENQINAHVEALFDQVHAYRRSEGIRGLGEAVALVKHVAPDLIFWPSVGMRHWGPALANLRLAPIQFTALGHSASTFCTTIDYYLTEEGYVGEPSLFSERLVLVPDESLLFERSPHYEPVAPSIRPQAHPVRVALPSNLLKLNPVFISVLQRIRTAAKRPLEFHVFPNVSHLDLTATRRAIARELPGSTVWEMMGYQRYLQRLSACDLNLSPFPFGGLHSVVDSLRQGLPVVAMEGLEPHARTDAMLLRRLGMPEWLICHDVEDYVGAALRIIGDDALRIELSQQAVGLDIDKKLFGDATTALRSEIVDAVWWMYQTHEANLASGRKVFSTQHGVKSPTA